MSSSYIIKRFYIAAFAVTAMIMSASCAQRSDGPQRVSVSGTVSLDSKPLGGATIQFVPSGQTTGPIATGKIVSGRFEFSQSEGPVQGTHEVRIFNDIELPVVEDPKEVKNAMKEHKEKLKSLVLVPTRYQTKSPLTATVSGSGPVTLSFELQSK